MNFFSLARSISPSTAWVCVSALTCRVMTCLASIWEAEGTLISPWAFLRQVPTQRRSGQGGKRCRGQNGGGEGEAPPSLGAVSC